MSAGESVWSDELILAAVERAQFASGQVPQLMQLDIGMIDVPIFCT